MRPTLRSRALPCIVALASLGALPCLAQVDPWEFEVYPYSTTPRGMAEFETDNSVVTGGHTNGGEGTAAGTLPARGCGTTPTSSPTASPTG